MPASHQQPIIHCMTTQLGGKVIAIAGGAGGLWPFFVKGFSGAGGVFAPWGRGATKQQHLIASLNLSATQHSRHTVDLQDAAQASAWAAAIQQQHGKVDGVMHLVGGWRGGTKIAQFPTEDWQLLNAMLIQTTWQVI